MKKHYLTKKLQGNEEKEDIYNRLCYNKPRVSFRKVNKQLLSLSIFSVRILKNKTNVLTPKVTKVGKTK